MQNQNLKNQFLNTANQIFTNSTLILNNQLTKIISINKINYIYYTNKLIDIRLYTTSLINNQPKQIILTFNYLTNKFNKSLQPQINSFINSYKNSIIKLAEAKMQLINTKYQEDFSNGLLRWQQNK